MSELHLCSTKAFLRALTPLRHRNDRPPVQARLIGQLRLRSGVHRWGDIIDGIWGDDPEGGPIDPKSCLNIAVHRLRELGVPIKTHPYVGLSLETA